MAKIAGSGLARRALREFRHHQQRIWLVPATSERELLSELLRTASAAGVHRLRAWVMPADVASLDLFRRRLSSIRIAPDNGLLHVTGVVDDQDPNRITMDDVLADLLW